MYRLSLLLSLVGSSVLLAGPRSPLVTLEDSQEILETLVNKSEIPAKLLADAQGVAIIPNVIKAGFIFGGRGGTGVVYGRNKDGSWGDPVFVHLGGASVGFQVGVESTDVVLVFRDRKSLDRILDGKGKVTLGADAAIAAGPVGRQAAAATDAKLQAEIWSYSRSRGLFAGVSLDGAAIVNDRDTNIKFRRDARPSELKMAESLRSKLSSLSGTPEPKTGPSLTPPPSATPPSPPPPPSKP
jgi:lipid-binding SYLF domain-containing protein